MINLEILENQRLAGIITHDEYFQAIYEAEEAESEEIEDVVDELEKGLKAALGNIEDEFEDAAEKKQDTNEGLLTAASIAIAIPAIMGVVAKFGKWAGKTISKMMGKKPNEESDYNKWMTKLGKISDDLHHLYMKPIEAIVKKFVKDPKKAHKIANIIFHVIVATFLVASGATAVKALQAKNLSLTTLEAALTAVKSGEITAFIGDAFELADVADVVDDAADLIDGE